ncbi:uncharacterized protein LOC112453243 [Temnothorax curvispinosus]|uniref:Uncharacterized protein LOC112453243 n=1 Tax=Temnothorax curvispinosus TaxID=300111 RepID=A0A6J1PKB8_9HYME|nr:uncharacterized protein LOC112453243 [Temnothorax curvispinosus]
MSLPAASPKVEACRREAEMRFPRWAHTKMDVDMLQASIHTSLWVDDLAALADDDDVDGAAEWIGGVMRTACNASMPRSKPHPRKAAYWWTEKIAKLRRSSVRVRRRWLRARRGWQPRQL